MKRLNLALLGLSLLCSTQSFGSFGDLQKSVESNPKSIFIGASVIAIAGAIYACVTSRSKAAKRKSWRGSWRHPGQGGTIDIGRLWQ